VFLKHGWLKALRVTRNPEDMPIPAFLIRSDTHRDSSLSQFAKTILKHPHRKTVGDVTLRELCGAIDQPHGVYVFFKPGGEVEYVGKATSRSFIERLPAHFDPREAAWFNTLTRRLQQFQASTYATALAEALELKVILVGVESTRLSSALEKFLRTALEPRLNHRSRQQKDPDPNTRLSDLI
jgi:hypothetical protein